LFHAVRFADRCAGDHVWQSKLQNEAENSTLLSFQFNQRSAEAGHDGRLDCSQLADRDGVGWVPKNRYTVHVGRNLLEQCEPLVRSD
jgi:hypothetical protein